MLNLTLCSVFCAECWHNSITHYKQQSLLEKYLFSANKLICYSATNLWICERVFVCNPSVLGPHTKYNNVKCVCVCAYCCDTYSSNYNKIVNDACSYALHGLALRSTPLTVQHTHTHTTPNLCTKKRIWWAFVKIVATTMWMHVTNRLFWSSCS